MDDESARYHKIVAPHTTILGADRVADSNQRARSHVVPSFASALSTASDRSSSSSSSASRGSRTFTSYGASKQKRKPQCELDLLDDAPDGVVSVSHSDHRPKRSTRTSSRIQRVTGAASSSDPVVVAGPATFTDESERIPPPPPSISLSSTSTSTSKSDAGFGASGIKSDSSAAASAARMRGMVEKAVEFIRDQKARLELIRMHPYTQFGKAVKGYLKCDMTDIFSNYSDAVKYPRQIVRDSDVQALAVALDSWTKILSGETEGGFAPTDSAYEKTVRRLLYEYITTSLGILSDNAQYGVLSAREKIFDSALFTGVLHPTDEFAAGINKAITGIMRHIPQLAQASRAECYYESTSEQVQGKFVELVALYMLEMAATTNKRPSLQIYPAQLRHRINDVLGYFTNCFLSGDRVMYSQLLRQEELRSIEATRASVGYRTRPVMHMPFTPTYFDFTESYIGPSYT